MSVNTKNFEFRMFVKKTIVDTSITGRQRLKRKPLVLFMVNPDGTIAGFMDEKGQVYLYTINDFNSRIDITNKNGKVKRIAKFSIIKRGTDRLSKEIKAWISKPANVRKYKTWYISEKQTIGLSFKRRAIVQILIRR